MCVCLKSVVLCSNEGHFSLPTLHLNTVRTLTRWCMEYQALCGTFDMFCLNWNVVGVSSCKTPKNFSYFHGSDMCDSHLCVIVRLYTYTCTYCIPCVVLSFICLMHEHGIFPSRGMCRELHVIRFSVAVRICKR